MPVSPQPAPPWCPPFAPAGNVASLLLRPNHRDECSHQGRSPLVSGTGSHQNSGGETGKGRDAVAQKCGYSAFPTRAGAGTPAHSSRRLKRQQPGRQQHGPTATCCVGPWLTGCKTMRFLLLLLQRSVVIIIKYSFRSKTIIIKYLFRSKTRHSKSQHEVWTRHSKSQHEVWTHTRLQSPASSSGTPWRSPWACP